MIRRTIAAALAAWLAFGQSVSAMEPNAPKPPAPKGEQAPARFLPHFSPKPESPTFAAHGLPLLKLLPGQTSRLPAPRPSPDAKPVLAVKNLTALYAAEEPGQTARDEYDGEESVRKPGSDPIAAAGSSQNPEPALEKPLIEHKSPAFKIAFTAGIAGAVAAPVAYHAAPPLMMLYTGLFGALSMARLWGVQKIWRWAARRFSGRRGAKDGAPLRAGNITRGHVLSISAGLFLGLSQGFTPTYFAREIVGLSARVAAPQRQIGALGPAFEREVIEVLSQNPEGRKLLDGLRDRGGTARLPDFYIGAISSGGFAFPPLNAVFLNVSLVTDDHWAASDFLKDPDKRRRFIREHDSLIYHELYHTLQFRKAVQPGQLEHFPRQFLGYFTYELEYEAYLQDRLFVHAKLKADPLAPISDSDFTDYRDFVRDADQYLDEQLADASYTETTLFGSRLPLYRHVDAKYYRDAFAKIKQRWPALSVEGCLLLARRYEALGQPTMSSVYQDMAVKRAKEYDLPAPDLSRFKYHDVRPRHAPSGNLFLK